MTPSRNRPSFVRRSLFSWAGEGPVWLHFLLLGAILFSVFFRVLPLEMQKRIVNQAISLGRQDLLILYSAYYLAAVLLSALLKFFINKLSAWMGQKILAAMRTDLYRHILTLPIEYFRRTGPGAAITSLTSELNTIGFFLGGAIAIPVTSGLLLVVLVGYMIWLEPLLGFIALAVYPVEIVVVPILQRRYNRLNVTRVDETRSMGNVINEAVTGIHEVQGNTGFALERKKLAPYIDRLYGILNRLMTLKYGIKLVNSVFQNLGPFLLFLIGGTLAIQGKFTLGALVAFLSAYEKVNDPWKEMMDYYQDYQDARVRYRRIQYYFDEAPRFEDEEYALPGDGRGADIAVADLSYTTDGGARILNGVSLSAAPGEHLALVGFSGSGKSTLAMVLARLLPYQEGSARLGGRELSEIPMGELARILAYVPQHPFIFDGTVRENILYSLEALELSLPPERRTALPGDQEILDMLDVVGFAGDSFRLGLGTVAEPREVRPHAAAFVHLRSRLKQEYGDRLDRAVEPFHVDRFMRHQSVYRNILFGDPVGEDFRLRNLPQNREFLRFLGKRGLYGDLMDFGEGLVRSLMAKYPDLASGDPPVKEGLVPEDRVDDFRDLCDRVKIRPVRKLSREEKALVLALVLRYVPARHNLVEVSGGFEAAVVEGRHRFMQEVGGVALAACGLEAGNDEVFDQPEKGGVVFYCPTAYLYSASPMNNLVFGTPIAEKGEIPAWITRAARNLLEEEGLSARVAAWGLSFQVGSHGDRLSGGQRQKIALARALLKKPRILILDEATASLDNQSQARVQDHFDRNLEGTTILAVVHRLDLAPAYDKIAVMKEGRIVEQGTHQTLLEQKGAYHALAKGTQ